MDFLIVPKNLPAETLHNRTKGWRHTGNDAFDLYYDPRQAETRPIGSSTLLLLGDFWNVPEITFSGTLSNTVAELVKTIRGNYYGILLEQETVHVFSCFLNLMPVFYSPRDRVVTSVFPAFGELQLPLTVSERYIFEALLFNYPFFNQTIYNEVKLLSTHHLFSLDNRRAVETEFFNVTELFIDNPRKDKRSYNELAEIFIRIVDEYAPDRGAAISFTGGFDGRTIVSSAMKLKKDFITFSFGKPENDDVWVPKKNAEELRLKYLAINPLENNYTEKHYSDNSIELSANSGGFNGFLYPHFLYMSKVISDTADVMITGYGGSEILRAAHVAGAVISQELYDIVQSDDFEILKETIRVSSRLKVLSQESVKNNLEAFINDLKEYKGTIAGLSTPNMKLYYFLLNETVRKIFGAWVYSQMKYIKVRTPYLDFNFVKSVYKTNLAGAYNDFFTHNPIKRFKGQLLYAIIISKTSKLVLDQVTGKGYPPKQLLSFYGKLKLVIPFFKRRLLRKVKKENIDNLGILSGINSYIENQLINSELSPFDIYMINIIKTNLLSVTNEQDRDLFLQYVSCKAVINT